MSVASQNTRRSSGYKISKLSNLRPLLNLPLRALREILIYQ